MKDLIIIGASGFGREVAWLVDRINTVTPTWNILGFIDDNPTMLNATIGGYPVLGGCEAATRYPDAWYVCAIGASRIRKLIIQKISNYISAKYATLIDPSVIISQRISLGNGSIVCAGSIITIDIQIGSHVIINLDCTIGHDAIINDFVTLYPSVNVSGLTNIGSCTEIGTGVQIIQGRKIGENSIIGAGAVVVKDIPPQCTAVGSPAKPIKYP